MKKGVLIVLSLLIFLPSFSFLSFAIDQPAFVNSPLPEPVASYSVENGVAHLVFHQIFYELGYPDIYGTGNGPYLVSYDCHYPVSNTVYVTSSAVYSGLASSANNVTYTTEIYRISDGAFMTSNYNSLPYGPLSIYGNNYPNMYVYCGLGRSYSPNATTPYFRIIPSGINEIQSHNLVNPYVNWGVNPAPVSVFHSSLSEPVADQYNRYIVLGSHDSQSAFLYMISFNEIEFEFTSSSTGTRNVSHNGQLWSLTCAISDDDIGIGFLFQPPSTLDQLSYMKFEMMFSKYDLLTGEYLGSQLFGDVQTSASFEIDVSSFFDSPDEYGSICVYGISCFIDGPVYHRFSCIWQTDPDFVTWRASVEDYLDKIYNILNKEVEAEDVTIDSDMSAVEEAESARDDLKVTDENGDPIDAAEQVEVAFSEAASGFGDLSDSIVGINGLINTMFFQHPIVLLPIIVALALGLLVTILGKNKSD